MIDSVSGPEDGFPTELLARRLRIAQHLSSRHSELTLRAFADLIALHTGAQVSTKAAGQIWADLITAGWLDPALPIEPVAHGIFPSLEIEVIRARCLNCGEPFNGIARVDGAELDQAVPGRTNAVLHVRMLHDCPVARERYRYERGRGTV